jgi:glycosyltransferase involved in cell wall biosynthesis
MKVLLISGEYPPLQGGMGDYTRELGQALAILGTDVHVLTSCRGEKGSEHVVVHPLIQRWTWRCWKPIVELVQRERPDVVHIQYQTAAYSMHPAINLVPQLMQLMASAARYRRPLHAVTFHDLRLPYLFPKAGPVRRWATQALARGCEAVVATNQEDELRLRQWGYGDKTIRIPIGSNIDVQPVPGYNRDEWRTRWGLGPDTVLLGYFGFLNASKGVDTLLHALSELLRRGEDAHLLMVGGREGASDPTNAAYARGIDVLIGELGLGNRVHWTGFVPEAEVSANLLAADLCVLPYRDGISFRRGSLMACVAHGRPIVSTRPSIWISQLREGDNVLLAPPDDPVALARRIADAAHDAALRRRLEEGARRLAQGFTWPTIAQQTLALYANVSRH